MSFEEFVRFMYNWRLKQEERRSLQERISSIQYSVTTSYGIGGGGGGMVHSKVESYCIRREKTMKELALLEANMQEIVQAVRNTHLSPMERGAIDCIMHGVPLLAYARREGIYKTRVYKAKDRALKSVYDVLTAKYR